MILYMLTMFHQCLVSKNLKLKNVPAVALSDMKGYKNVKRSRKSFTYIQCKQPVEAAEDEINLVVEEETHKDKGLLFVPSISGLFLFFCHHFLYSVVPS